MLMLVPLVVEVLVLVLVLVLVVVVWELTTELQPATVRKTTSRGTLRRAKRKQFVRIDISDLL